MQDKKRKKSDIQVKPRLNVLLINSWLHRTAHHIYITLYYINLLTRPKYVSVDYNFDLIFHSIYSFMTMGKSSLHTDGV